MVYMDIVYQGKFHCELTHGPSQSKIETDAPKDNQGKGERFSPTDLIGAALGSCILTTMDMAAKADGFSIEGAKASVEKAMTSAPRRIQSLTVQMTLPARLNAEQRKKLEDIAVNCPVHRSLHPDVQMPMTFQYI
jgi:putative redox protein